MNEVDGTAVEPVATPDGVSKALEKKRLAHDLSYWELGCNILVSTPRAKQLCQGTGQKIRDKERFMIAQFLGRSLMYKIFEPLTFDFAELGDGDLLNGFSVVDALAVRLRRIRESGSDEQRAALRAACLKLEQADEDKKQDAALGVIVAAMQLNPDKDA